MLAWLIPSLMALAFYGVWGFLPKLSAKYLNPTSAVLYEVIGGVIVGVIILAYSKGRLEFNPYGMMCGIGTGMCMLAGGLCYLYAAKNGNLAVVVTLTAFYPAITVLLSYFVLGDPISPQQLVGIGLGLVAIVLIAA